MTKTISINLGGLLFHIDDKAFETLKAYLQSIEKQFKDEKEKREIIADIEARIAELLSERLDRNTDLVTEEDISTVISIMGEPHDFVDDENQEPQGASKQQYHRTYSTKRMYRNPDDRIFGGVCSGLGAYFNVDSWVFRTIFIIFTIFFFVGFVVYVILWIATPEAITTAQKLEMRGEPITVENIKNAVKEEFDNVKHRMQF